MNRYLALALAVSAAALAAALAAGPSSTAALLGAGIAAATGLASIVAFRLFGGTASKPMQRALAIFVVMFLVRIVAVALGVVAVVRLGQSPIAFVVAFFVPYFIFVAIEGGYVHALGRAQGRTA